MTRFQFPKSAITMPFPRAYFCLTLRLLNCLQDEERLPPRSFRFLLDVLENMKYTIRVQQVVPDRWGKSGTGT